MYLIFLFVLLIIITIFSFYLNKRDIIAPSFIFSLSFLFCSSWCVLYYKKWEMKDFHLNTFLVILSGVITFLIFSLLIKYSFEKNIAKEEKETKKKSNSIDYIRISPIFKIVFFIFNILVLFGCLISIIKMVGGSWNNIVDAIYKYDQTNKFSNSTYTMPKLVGIGLLIAHALTYWYIYIFINNFLFNKKIDIIILLTIISGASSSIAQGGRNGVVNMIIFGIVIFIMLYRKKYNKKLRYTIKQVIISISFLIIILVLFMVSAKLMGRKISNNYLDYLAVYCGAEIKNLDIFLQELKSYDFDNNSQTFYNIVNWIGPKLGLTKEYKLDIPFRNINGFNLGNVYTTFYSFIYDYGYIGAFLCTAFMAGLTQIIYELSLKEKLKEVPSIFTMIYGYMFSSILLSFFSNKFYEQNFSKNFIYSLLFWIFMNWIEKKLKNRKKIKTKEIENKEVKLLNEKIDN